MLSHMVKLYLEPFLLSNLSILKMLITTNNTQRVHKTSIREKGARVGGDSLRENRVHFESHFFHK